MRILVNFMERDGWFVHCIAPDAKTPISPIRKVRTRESLMRLLRYIGANDEDVAAVNDDIRRWSRGGVWIELAPGRKNLLGIRLPYSQVLEDKKLHR